MPTTLVDDLLLCSQDAIDALSGAREALRRGDAAGLAADMHRYGSVIARASVLARMLDERRDEETSA